jgi:hypothetical protein
MFLEPTLDGTAGPQWHFMSALLRLHLGKQERSSMHIANYDTLRASIWYMRVQILPAAVRAQEGMLQPDLNKTTALPGPQSQANCDEDTS